MVSFTKASSSNYVEWYTIAIDTGTINLKVFVMFSKMQRPIF